MLLTIPLILLTCGLSLASAWISGHAEELAVQETPKRAWLPKAGFWLSVVGLSSAIFAILLPILTSFINLESDGIYLDTGRFIAGLWPLYLVIAAALAVNLVMLVNSVRAPKPKAKLESGASRRYGYYGYPRSYFIFLPMRSHRRIAASPRYYPAPSSAQASGAFAGGMSSRPGAAGAYSGGAYSGGMSGGMSSRAGASTGAGYPGGMTGGMSSRAGTGEGMTGGMSSRSGSKSTYKRDSNNRSMNSEAGLIMLAVMAIAGGYHGAKAVKKMGGKRQAEINHLWRTAEAQRVIREHDEEQEAKLKAQFADIAD